MQDCNLKTRFTVFARASRYQDTEFEDFWDCSGSQVSDARRRGSENLSGSGDKEEGKGWKLGGSQISEGRKRKLRRTIYATGVGNGGPFYGRGS